MKEPAEGVVNMREDESETEQSAWETPNRSEEVDPGTNGINFGKCPDHGKFDGLKCPRCPKRPD